MSWSSTTAGWNLLRRSSSNPASAAQASGDAAGGLAVPQLGAHPVRPVAGEHRGDRAAEIARRDESVGALGDGDWPLRRVAQGEAGNVEIGRLFLDTAR